ncbi:MAG TPA: hypothetical protein EYP21_07255 [Syntrophaceae bacterium]|nr:hypothetical protein [Syntrophaceae bacterium]
MKSLLSLIFISYLLCGCVPTLTVAELEQKYGVHKPVIRRYFASDTVRNGDIWRVYLSAHDPDGDMEFIAITVDQTGIIYDPELIFIPKENRETITGYLYLHIPVRGIWFEKITLSLSILDKAGHKSNEVFLPLYICDESPKPLPPEFGEEFEKALGWIPISLRSPHYQYLEDPEILGHPDVEIGIWP